jgi:hypothetical protein
MFPSPVGEDAVSTVPKIADTQVAMAQLFPFPLGEDIVSTTPNVIQYEWIRRFPSPLGEDIVSTQLNLNVNTRSQTRFPSPLGEDIVSTSYTSIIKGHVSDCFHPLSGKTLCQLLAQGALPSKGSSLQIDTPIFFGRILFSSSRF